MIKDLLHIVRQLYKEFYHDEVLNYVYLEFGLAISRLIQRDEISYYDNFNKEEVKNKVFNEVDWLKANHFSIETNGF
ncbi:hypothetical protein MXE62_03005 [Staphylococcus haemolyticus]|uniref:hypothetical protein n=1 Tax=Staphylococcus haemolyticus TaxID=1283 RepID=UPI002203A85C|nr:hypothetical protein [Staphylococcus haemolyticus]MEB5827160.1 hypothetical protein [Staphylococcus haemolyticus]